MKKLVLLICAIFTFSGCKISLNGASIGDVKTVSVQLFENNAPLVVPYLSSQFTEDFKARIRNQTALLITTNDADAMFTGNISNYEIIPVAIQDNRNPVAGANRLNIRVNVKYTNNLNPKLSFEESFERYEEFKLGGQSIQALEPQLIKSVTAKLTEDIFNRAFANW